MVLLWLLPPVVVTCAAMAWVSWLGRESRGEVDRDAAVRRMAGVLEPVSRRARRRARRVPGYAAPAAPADRSSGVALRRSSRSVRPPLRAAPGSVAPAHATGDEQPAEAATDRPRRAS